MRARSWENVTHPRSSAIHSNKALGQSERHRDFRDTEIGIVADRRVNRSRPSPASSGNNKGEFINARSRQQKPSFNTAYTEHMETFISLNSRLALMDSFVSTFVRSLHLCGGAKGISRNKIKRTAIRMRHGTREGG